MKFKLLFLFLIISSQACKNDQTQAQKIGVKNVRSIHFDWKNSSTDPLNPNNAVYLVVNDIEYQIGSTKTCERINKSEFDDFSIPASAVDACGGWWAGSGNYFFINQTEDGKYWIYEATANEKMQSKNFEYETLLSINRQGIWKPKTDLNRLPGVYTLRGHGESWTMVIELKDQVWNVGFAKIDGLLPSRDKLPQVYLDSDPILLEKFDLNPFMLIFDSDLGKGYFTISEKNVECTFVEQKGNGISQLKLLKER